MDTDDIQYTLVRSNRRTLAIVVERDGSVTVRSPRRCPLRAIEGFVASKRGWLEKTLGENIKRRGHVPRALGHGEALPFLGNTISICLSNSDAAAVRLSGGRLLVDTHDGGAAGEYVRESIEGWYRDRALETFRERVAAHEPAVGVRASRVRVSNARYRWGSCSRSGSINLSWRLVMAPLGVVDYVVVHELCHIIHHDHSRRFWGEVERVLPDYKSPRTWIRQNGDGLYL